MRTLLFSSLFVAVSLIIILVLGAFLPKYSGMLVFFFFFLLFDGYLWWSVHTGIKNHGKALRMAGTGLFWLPVASLSCLVAYGLFVPFLEWNVTMRTFVQSFILILFLTQLMPMITLILADIFRMMKFLVHYSRKEKLTSVGKILRFRPLLVTGWILGGLIFMAMIAGTIFWQFDFRVKEHRIVLRDLPPAFEGFRIVQFSDVHLGSWTSKQKLQEAMDIINGLKPDVVFFTGDMFNYSTADGRGFENILASLHAPHGIYAILGNHDYGDYVTWPSEEAHQTDREDAAAYFNNLGWRLMLNSNEVITKGSDTIAVIGVENWGSTRRFQRYGDIEKAQQGTGSVAVRLLLSHDPTHWDSVVRQQFPDIDITFSGHTHGGQIGFDLENFKWSPVQYASTYWSGLYENPDPGEPQYLYVNQGLGNIGYAGRIGILPEITLITLIRR